MNLSSALSLNLSATFNFSVSLLAGFQGNVKLPLGSLPFITWDMDLATFKMVTDDSGLSIKFFGVEIKKEAPVKLQAEDIRLVKKAITLKKSIAEVSEMVELKL